MSQNAPFELHWCPIACPEIWQNASISALIKPIGLCGTQDAQKNFRTRPTIFQNFGALGGGQKIVGRVRKCFCAFWVAQSRIALISTEIGVFCRIPGHANVQFERQMFGCKKMHDNILQTAINSWHTAKSTPPDPPKNCGRSTTLLNASSQKGFIDNNLLSVVYFLRKLAITPIPGSALFFNYSNVPSHKSY